MIMNLQEAEMGLKLNDPSRTNDITRLNHYWMSKGFREGHAQGVEEERKRAEILVVAIEKLKLLVGLEVSTPEQRTLIGNFHKVDDGFRECLIALSAYKAQREEK
jgi:hypothetical protein